jgi:hypothetical protein
MPTSIAEVLTVLALLGVMGGITYVGCSSTQDLAKKKAGSVVQRLQRELIPELGSW